MNRKKLVSEGRVVGEAPANATPGQEIQVKTGQQDGHDTYRTYIVEQNEGSQVIAHEKPLLG